MAKPNINSIADLMQEKARLKESLKKRKARLNNSFEELKAEVNPFTSLQKSAGTVLQANAANPFIKMGINKATELILGKVILKKAGWLPKLIVPFIVKEVTSRIVGHKPDKKIADTLRKAADGIRNLEIPDFSNASKNNHK